jgi:hypothetical protein
MRLALLIILLTARTAGAIKPHDCACPRRIELPAPNATDVPTNARWWSIPETGIAEKLGEPIDRRGLAPNTPYDIHGVKFTTGAGPDTTPPTEPRIGYVSVALEPGDPAANRTITMLHVGGTFDADTALVRIRLIDGNGTSVMYTTPHHLSLCGAQIGLVGGEITVAVAALDLAGNESPETTVHTTTTDDAPRVLCGRAVPAAHDSIVNDIAAPFLIALIAVIAFALRSRSRRDEPATPMALTSVELLARTMRTHATLRLLSVGSVAAVGATVHDLLALVLTVSPLLALLGWQAAARWWQAHGALSLLTRDGVAATVRGDRVDVVAGRETVTLHATTHLIAHAQEHALPEATLDGE